MDVQESDLPFKAGQHVESRSFEEGFRGSWFRSQIHSIHRRRNNDLGYKLKFLDFPDEKITWTKICQKPPAHNSRKSKLQNQVIMVRPRFPPVHRESQMPDVNAISEPIVIGNDALKVGDLIDWWTDGCYWSGSITQILKDDKFKIQLLPPPHGEGASYEASLKDMRPSLDWSLEHGWTVPAPLDSDLHSCARIIHPANFKQGPIQSLPPCTAGEERGDLLGKSGELKSSVTSRKKSKGLERRVLGSEAQKSSLTPEPNKTASRIESDAAGKSSCSNTGSDSHVRAKSTERARVSTNVGKERLGELKAGKKTAQSINGTSVLPVTLPKPQKDCKTTEEPPLNVEPGKEIGVNGKASGSGSDNLSRVKVSSMGTGDKNAPSLVSSRLSPNGNKLGTMGKQSSRLDMEHAKVGKRDGTDLEEAEKEAVDQGASSKLRSGSMDSSNKIGNAKEMSESPSLASSSLSKNLKLGTMEKRPSRLVPGKAKFGKRDKIDTAKAVYHGAAMKMRLGSVETGYKTGVAQDRSDSPSLTPSHSNQKVENLGAVGKQPSVYHGAAMKMRPGSVETGNKTGVAQDRSDSPSLTPSHSTKKLGTVGTQPSGLVAKETAEPPGIDSAKVEVRKRGESETEKEEKPSKKMRIDRNMPTDNMLSDTIECLKAGSIEKGNKVDSPSLALSSLTKTLEKLGTNGKPSGSIPKEAAEPSGVDSKSAEVVKRDENEIEKEENPSTELPSLVSSSLPKTVDKLGITGKQPSDLMPKEAAKPSGSMPKEAAKPSENETKKEAEPSKEMRDVTKMPGSSTLSDTVEPSVAASSRGKAESIGTRNKTGVARDMAESPSLDLSSTIYRVDKGGTMRKQPSGLVANDPTEPSGMNSENTIVEKKGKNEAERKAKTSKNVANKKMPINSRLPETGDKTVVVKDTSESPVALPSLTQHVDKLRESAKRSSKLVSEDVELKQTGETDSEKAEKESDDHGIAGRKLPRNSMFSETVESSIIDLEELLCMVKWMKGVLRNDSSSQPPWKFVGHRASSTPR